MKADIILFITIYLSSMAFLAFGYALGKAKKLNTIIVAVIIGCIAFVISAFLFMWSLDNMEYVIEIVKVVEVAE